MSITAGQTALASDLVHIKQYLFTADEDLTIGQTVGISNYLPSASVGRAKRVNATATLSFTSGQGLGNPNFSCPIGGDKFVFLDDQTSNDSLYATVGSINRSTKVITLGTSVAVTADVENGDYWAVCKLDTDKFIVFYKEDASTTIIKYRVGTVSGTTITFGSATTFTTGATVVNTITCDQISTNKGIMFYGTNTNTDSRLICFTTSGTVATAGTPLAIGATIDDSLQRARVKKVNTDKFILVTPSKRAQVGTVSGGTTITLGSEAVVTTIAQNSFVDIVSPANDVAVVSYKDGSNIGEIVACTISGTTATFGTPITMTQNDGTLYSESSTSILVQNASNSYIKKYSLSGTTLTLIGKVIDNATSNPQKIVPIDNGYFCLIQSSGTTFTYFIQGMSNSFNGIAQATVSRGATVLVVLQGIDVNQSGLIPGATYEPDGSGGLSVVSSTTTKNSADDRFLTAISETEILLGY